MLKPIKNYERYLIDPDNGNIYSNAKGKKMFPLKTFEKPDGYLAVTLWDDSIRGNKKRKTFLVHRLVAETFIPNPENKPTVNHKDGNKKNNCVTNLEWATSHEQNVHAFSNGLNYARKGEEANRAQLTWDDVHFIRNNYPDISVAELSLKFNITKECIYSILYNYNWIEENYKPESKGLCRQQKTSKEVRDFIYNNRNKYTGKELAKMFNISESTVSVIKNGRYM